MVVINLSRNKMKFFIVIIVFVASVHSKREEITEELKELLKDPQIYKLIAKRFQNLLDEDHGSNKQETSVVDTTSTKHLPVNRPSSNLDKSLPFPDKVDDSQKNSPCKRRHGGYGFIGDSEGNKCDYKENQKKIIRSNESVEAGAVFLRSEKSSSQCDCVKTCCFTQGCTLAVFENKNNHSCYLFNCANNKCKFADHGSYIAMTLGDYPDESDTQHEGSSLDHEGQLKDLGKGAGMKRPTPKPTPVPQKTPVPLHAKCDTEAGDSCLDKNAACIGGTCSCTENFHDRLNLGVCIMKCTSNQFECKSKAGCIGRNQVCDGTRHCSDGSDERDCPKKDAYLEQQAAVNKVVPSSNQQQSSKVSSQLDSANFGPPVLHQTVLNSGSPIKQQVPQTILGGYPPLAANTANQAYGIQQQAYNGLYNPSLGQKLNNAGGYISNPILNPSSNVVNPSQQLQGTYWGPQAANGIPLTQQQNSGYYDTSGFLNSNLGSSGLLNGPSQYISPAGTQNRPLYGQDVSGMVNSRLPIPPSIQQGSMDKYIAPADAVSDNRQYGADGGRHYNPVAGTDVDADRQYILDNRPGTDSRHFLSNDETNPVRQSNLDPFIQQGYNSFKKGDHGKFQKGLGSRQYVDNQKNMRKLTTLKPTTKSTTTTTTTTTTIATTTRATTPPKPTTQASVPASVSSLDETQFSKWGNSQGDGSLGDHGENDPLYRGRARGRGRVGKGQNHNGTGRKFHGKNSKQGKPTEVESRRHNGENRGDDKFGRYQNNVRNRPAGSRQQMNKNRYNYYDLYHSRYPNYPNYDFDSTYYDIPNSDIQMNRPVSYDYETNGKDFNKNEEETTEPKNSNQDKVQEGVEHEKAGKSKVVPPSTHAPVETPNPQPKDGSKDDKKVEDKLEQTKEEKVDSKTTSKETQSPVKNTQASTKDKSMQSITVETDKIAASKPTNKSSNQSSTQSKPKTSPKAVSQNKKKNPVIQITEEDSGLVVVHTFDDQSKAPIVALSLGLAITLMLLVFVGCRLRNVKRRIRKGRALHSNEADYLINGMYL